MLSSILYLTKILLPDIPEDDGGICLMEVYGVAFRNEDFFFLSDLSPKIRYFFGSLVLYEP